MPHAVIVSPLQEPLTYALFAITWLSSIIAFLITVYFYSRRREAWWLVIGLAVVLPLIFEVTMALSHGLPPLPYRLEYPPVHQGSDDLADLSALDKGLPQTRGETIIEYSVSRVQWSFYPPLMATGLVWAYLRDKKQRPTAGT